MGNHAAKLWTGRKPEPPAATPVEQPRRQRPKQKPAAVVVEEPADVFRQEPAPEPDPEAGPDAAGDAPAAAAE